MNESTTDTVEVRPSFRTDDRRRIARTPRTELIVSGNRVIYRGPFRTREVLQGRPVSRVVVTSVRFLAGRRTRLWILLTSDGRAVLSLNQEAWPEAGLERIRQRLRVPVEIRDVVLRPRQPRSIYPGAIPWWAV